MHRVFRRALALIAIVFLGASASGEEIEICTFNVYKLGAVAEKYDGTINPENDEIPERVLHLASVLTERDFALICLQEVRAGAMGEAVIADLVRALDEFHDVRYDWMLSEHIGQGLIPEAIAFLYDPSRITPQPVNISGAYSDLLAIPGRDLVHTSWVAGEFDFTMFAAHLAWGSEADRDAGFLTVGLILSEPELFSEDPDVIVLGDFNRFGKGLRSADFLDHDPGDFYAPNAQFFDPDVHEIPRVTIDSIAGLGVPDDDPQRLSTTVAQNRYVYDMIMFSPDAAEEYSAGELPGTLGTDFGILYFDEAGWPGHQPGAEAMEHNDLKEAYSDHRPLWARFVIDAGDADTIIEEPEPAAEETLFVGTDSGRRFHLPTCWTIDESTITLEWTTLDDALADRRPCGVCKPEDHASEDPPHDGP